MNYIIIFIIIILVIYYFKIFFLKNTLLYSFIIKFFNYNLYFLINIKL
jgi:hypothetical protein